MLDLNPAGEVCGNPTISLRVSDFSMSYGKRGLAEFDVSEHRLHFLHQDIGDSRS